MRIQAILFRSRENHISDVLHNSFARTEIYCQQQWFIQTDSPQWLIFMTHLKFITGFLTWKQTPEQYETLTVKGDLIISIPRSFEKFNIMWRLWQALFCFIPIQQQLNNSDWSRIWPMRWRNETCLVFLHKRRFRNSIFKVYLYDLNDCMLNQAAGMKNIKK